MVPHPAGLERPAITALLATLLLAPQLAASPPPPPPPPPPVHQPAADTIVGTLHTLDTSAGTLRVTTGVGMALRLVELRLTPETRVTEGGAPLAIAALRPGDVVRVTGGAREQALVAYTIERLRAGPGGAP
jgi:hypothetical protein